MNLFWRLSDPVVVLNAADYDRWDQPRLVACVASTVGPVSAFTHSAFDPALDAAVDLALKMSMGRKLLLMDTEFSILLSDTDTFWKQHAVCSSLTEVFFGPASERPERRVEREALARSFCRVCPAMLPCRRTGRANREHGIWGGETDEERAAAGYAPRSPSRRSVLSARDLYQQVECG